MTAETREWLTEHLCGSLITDEENDRLERVDHEDTLEDLVADWDALAPVKCLREIDRSLHRELRRVWIERARAILAER